MQCFFGEEIMCGKVARVTGMFALEISIIVVGPTVIA
jgi:hypothetical protein